MDKFSEIRNDYINFHTIEKNNYGGFYRGIDKNSNRDVCLKIYDKTLLEKGKTNFLLKQIEREIELNKLCKNENILEFYERKDTQNFIVLKYEPFDYNLMQFLYKNGELKRKKILFKKIIQCIANALKVFSYKKVIHRDIKPNNIFLKANKSSQNDFEIKLGNFSSSVLIEDNDYKQIGTILYTSPEIFKNIKYSEKIDLWSLGITLYYIYFGMSPYGYNVNLNLIKHTLYGKKFIYLFSDIPNLDILFKRLLTINPNERMSHEEFCEYVLNEDFMNPDIIYIKNKKDKYEKINLEIKKIKNSEKYKKLLKNKEELINKENECAEEQYKNNLKKIIDIVSVDNIPGLTNFSKGDINQYKKIKYNNIIYYDENIEDYKDDIHEDSDLFEQNTQGAFLLCTNITSLNLLMGEISKECTDDKNIEFNLIVTGSKCQKVMEKLIEKDYEKYFKNVCIYCINVEDYLPLKSKYSKIFNVYDDPFDIVEYIKKFSSEKIKPFRVTKLVNYQEYNLYYFAWHKKISEFYGDLNPESYKKYIQQMESFINEEKDDNLYMKSSTLIESFKTFNIDNDLNELDKKIINEYTKETFYGDINKWLMNFTINSFEEVSYFTSRLMYSLNNYAISNNKYCTENNKLLYRGAQISYSSLLAYERSVGKIIVLSAFTSSSEDYEFAKEWAGRDEINNDGYEGIFSVIFYITNKWENNWISNGIDIQEISEFGDEEKEVLFQPFSFYYVNDVKFDLEKYYANIYLETIGKTEILEKAIHDGKKIEYKEDLKLIQVCK